MAAHHHITVNVNRAPTRDAWSEAAREAAARSRKMHAKMAAAHKEAGDAHKEAYFKPTNSSLSRKAAIKTEKASGASSETMRKASTIAASSGNDRLLGHDQLMKHHYAEHDKHKQLAAGRNPNTAQRRGVLATS